MAETWISWLTPRRYRACDLRTDWSSIAQLIFVLIFGYGDRMRTRYLLAPIAALAVLTGCTAQSTPAEPAATPSATPSLTEVSSANPRVVLAHEGGLTTLDSTTGETLGTTELDGFLRLNDAGDGRHVMVTQGDKFLVFDGALVAEPHGDHSHYYAGDPSLTSVSYEASKAGHVVVHNDRTVLFGDGDGSIQVIGSEQIAEPNAVVRRYQTDAPHHGVALQLSDGTLFLTQGTEEARSTLQVRRGEEIVAQTDDCPGSHGEATAKPNASGDVVVVGCTNGPAVYRDGAFHKVPVADAYARSGNLAGSANSPIVLGDYKSDENAEQEHPTRVALIDTTKDSLKLVELGSSYWFRSLGRGPDGEALVLTYDGSLKVIDPTTGTVTASIPVIDAWEEKPEWQSPGPILKVAGDKAYVTDAEKGELVVVDLHEGAVTERHTLSVTPVEMAIVTGTSAEAAHQH